MSEEKQNRIAVILIRSTINVRPDVKRTLKQLGIEKKNSCAIIKDTASSRGMLQKAKDYITWGEIDEKTKNKLEKRKKGKIYALAPPRNGFGKKGIKVPFALGGGLGDRKEAINDLLMRMM